MILQNNLKVLKDLNELKKKWEFYFNLSQLILSNEPLFLDHSKFFKNFNLIILKKKKILFIYT